MIKLILLFIFSFTSLAQETSSKKIPKIDPDKFTICAATINSDNERAVFEAEIKKNPSKFNPIVELTNFGEDDWFDKACASKIRCDQLVVSGHFGGTFFGSSGKRLELNLLEEKGCSKTCEGILSSPYEVFLFGCNTLSSKEADHRTPEQYLRVLLDDGIPRRQAEMVVEARYGATGDDNKSKMQRAFNGNNKHLYGFSSVGPSGKNVEGFLKNYFSKVNIKDRLESLQAKRMMNQVESFNKELAENLKTTAFAQCQTGSGTGGRKNEILCGLIDPKRTVNERIALMEEALADDNYLIYIHGINEFLKSNPVAQMTPSQLASIQGLKENKIIHNQLTSLLKSTKNIRFINEWSEFSHNLGFIDEKERIQYIRKYFVDAFKNEITNDDKDYLCSLNTKVRTGLVSYEDIKDIKLNDKNLQAIACLRTIDKNLQLKVLREMQSVENFGSLQAARTLNSLTSLDKDVQLKLVDIVRNPNPVVSNQALIALRRKDITDKAVLDPIVDVLKKTSASNRETAIRALSVIAPQDPDIQLRILEISKNFDMESQVQVIEIFQSAKPTDKRVLSKLLDIMDNKNVDVLIEVSKTISEIKPQDKDTQLKLIELIKNPSSKSDSISGDIASVSADMLSAINSQDKEIQISILNLQEDPSLKYHSRAIIFATDIKDPEVQLKVVEKFSTDSRNEQNDLVKYLEKLKPQDKNVQLKMIDYLDTRDSYFKSEMVSLIRELKPQDVDVQLKLVNEIIKSKDGTHIGQMSQILSDSKTSNRQVQSKLIDMLKDKDYLKNSTAFVILRDSKISDKEIQIQLIQSINSSNSVSKIVESFQITDDGVWNELKKKDKDLWKRMQAGKLN